MKPMLASDYDESKLRFPLIVQPKIDGVRGLNIGGGFTGRSLKQFGNAHVTALFSHPLLAGCDGEVAAQKETHPDLCRLTTSALSTQAGEPFVLWWLFDYITEQTQNWGYEDRFDRLREHYHDLQRSSPIIAMHLRLMPERTVFAKPELDDMDSRFLDAGYEGTIVRDPMGKHKQGRSTVREGGLLRIKRFVDFEFRIDGVVEGEANQNEATINELGHTERSTHQANMIPNGMVGALLGHVVTDVVADGKVLFSAGQPVCVGAGRLTHHEREHYFQHPELIVGRIGKGKLFPKGIKDKPRFPTFQSFRDAVDMGGE